MTTDTWDWPETDSVEAEHIASLAPEDRPDPEEAPPEAPEPETSVIAVPAGATYQRETLVTVAEAVVERVAVWHRTETDARDVRLGGAPPVTADVADVVRRLVETAEDLDAVAAAFKAAADAVRGFVTEEALAVGTDRLTVPDGLSEIVVAPAVRREVWVETDALRDVVAARIAAGFAADLEGSGLVGGVVDDLSDAHLAGVKAGFEEVLRLATPSWKTTALGGLRQDLLAQHADGPAAALERAYGTRKTPSEDLRVTREPLKKGRRA